MSSLTRRLLIAASLTLLPAVLVAQQQESSDITAEQFTASLTWQNGDVVLKNGLATLHLPEGYRYLGPEDAERVLTAWGNLPGTKVLGMIFPASMSPVDDGAWGVVVDYDEDGHVDDADAASIDYKQLLKEMQEGAESRNAERRKQGVPTATLVGWASPPFYDDTAHKLHWARELKFSGEEENTINWDIRVLGARGVLDLNAVGAKSQLETLEAGMDDIIRFVDFNPGHRYADYNPSVDHKAEYGIAALVAGGLVAKSGILKVILAALLAMKKLVIIAIAGIAGFIKKLFGRKTEPATATPNAAS
ncbi:MAG TPA: DUF2167 domain-containing protein [Gemmatimonadaceae bacterium]|nr:DUF2167 domain-containing protein [Gemmatimonadaceae bacterium]